MSRKKYGSGPANGGFSTPGFYSGPSRGAIMGSSIANGLTGALGAYQAAQRNKMMMGMYMQNMQNQQQLRQLQAQKLQQEIAPLQVDMQKLQMLHQAQQGGMPVPQSVVKEQYQKTLGGIQTPGQMQYVQQALQGHIQSQNPSQPQQPSTSMTLSPNEAKFYGKALGNMNAMDMSQGRNQSAQDIARINAESKINATNAHYAGQLQVAKEMGASREKIAKIQSDYHMAIAKVQADTGIYRADQGLAGKQYAADQGVAGKQIGANATLGAANARAGAAQAVAGINNAGRVQAANIGAGAKTQAATIGAGARVQSAQINNSDTSTPGGATYDSDAAKSILKQIENANKAIIAGPPKSGILPPMPTEVQKFQTAVQNHRAELYNQYQNLTGTDLRGTPAGQSQSQAQPAPQQQGYHVPAQPLVLAPQPEQYGPPAPVQAAPAPSAASKVVPWDQRKNAGVGDMIQAPDNRVFKVTAPGQLTPVDPAPAAGQ